MKTIKETINYEFTIKNSKFISRIYHVNNVNEVNSIMEKVKNEFPNATHYCYSYIINNNIKACDDNEPNGTAGNAILQVLQKNNLDYVLCIVVRYFGGIKLGSSLLFRSYSKACSEALKKGKIITLTKGYKVKITCSYNEQKNILSFLKEKEYQTIYGEQVIYIVNLSKEDISKISNLNYQIIEEILIDN